MSDFTRCRRTNRVRAEQRILFKFRHNCDASTGMVVALKIGSHKATRPARNQVESRKLPTNLRPPSTDH
jgi:hypothetical protein